MNSYGRPSTGRYPLLPRGDRATPPPHDIHAVSRLIALIPVDARGRRQPARPLIGGGGRTGDAGPSRSISSLTSPSPRGTAASAASVPHHLPPPPISGRAGLRLPRASTGVTAVGRFKAWMSWGGDGAIPPGEEGIAPRRRSPIRIHLMSCTVRSNSKMFTFWILVTLRIDNRSTRKTPGSHRLWY